LPTKQADSTAVPVTPSVNDGSLRHEPLLPPPDLNTPVVPPDPPITTPPITSQAATPAPTAAAATVTQAPVAQSQPAQQTSATQPKSPAAEESKAQETQSADAVKMLIQEELHRQPSEFSIVRLIDLLVAYASLTHSSDVHIDPTPDQLKIRFRIDGILHDEFVLPKIIQSVFVSRIKILCGLRTDEHQAPQDGRFKSLLKEAGTVDVRVSIVPTYYGENVEMRLLQSPSSRLTLDDLDMAPNDLAQVKHAVNSPYGMILATGPTGSGKTTMLYTILKTLNTPDVSVITIEDPIEYSIPGIIQIPVAPQAGLTFAAGLRSILRQDPNIVMVGEIRDEETAEIAVNAALTGHLLLSTLHTNDAATTLARLTEFKIEPFLIASTVNVAIGQRLVRRLCEACRETKSLTDIEFQSLTESIPADLLGTNRNYFVGKGCKLCGNSGYTGRTGIYEVLVVNDEIRSSIMKRANASEIVAIAIKHGMTTMLQDGIRKAQEGKTTLEEVLRVVHE
jgi:general secretion pathway protein E